MTDDGLFAVDLAELDAVIADVQATETELEQLTADLAHQIAALHEVWEGLAAEAQRAAHRTWEQGMVAMREALAELRAAGRTAHGNYSGAAQSNVDMWGSLS